MACFKYSNGVCHTARQRSGHDMDSLVLPLPFEALSPLGWLRQQAAVRSSCHAGTGPKTRHHVGHRAMSAWYHETMKSSRPIDWPERRAAALHRLIADTLVAHPERLAVGIENLDRWEARGVSARTYPYFKEWRRRLALGLDVCVATLRGVEDAEQPLRSCEPFAGVVPEAERLALIREHSHASR